MDDFADFKEQQRKTWVHFAPLQAITTTAAAKLVAHARIGSAAQVLDVACGTGVVAVTAARRGARVIGLDLTPELLVVARENAQIAGVAIDWREGDVEALPFADASFDAVVSQFGHMFAPRPERAIGEMLRVLRPGGTLAFSTWPPELFMGRMFALVSQFSPSPFPGLAPPPLWGDPSIVRERLGTAVRDIVFDRGTILAPALSPQHHRAATERAGGPLVKLVESLLASDPDRLAQLRRDYDALAAEYFADNAMRQDFLMTRATKA